MRRLGAVLFAVVLGACGGGSDDDVRTEASDESVGTAEPEPPATEASPSGLDTAGLAERILLSDAEFEYEDDFAFFDGCVVTDPDAVLTGLFRGLVPAEVEAAIGVPDVTFASALRLPVNGLSLIGCTVAPDLDGVGFDVATAPSSVEAYAREFNLPDGDIQGAELIVEEIGAEAGGTLHTVVLTDVNDPELQSGEIAWIDEHVMVTAYGFGPELHEIDLDELRRRFVEQLPAIVDTALR